MPAPLLGFWAAFAWCSQIWSACAWVTYNGISADAVDGCLTNSRMHRRWQTWLRGPASSTSEQWPCLTLSFPICSPPFPLMSRENETMFHTQAPQADADAPSAMTCCPCTASSRLPRHMAAGDLCSFNDGATVAPVSSSSSPWPHV